MVLPLAEQHRPVVEVLRVVPRPLAEMPLADEAGRVSDFLQHFGNEHFVGTNAERRIRPQHAAWRDGAIGAGRDDVVHADAHRVATGHERGPRRGAGGRRGMEVGEPHPLLGHAVEVRRVHVDGAEAGEVGIAHVIGEDDNDVGLLRSMQGRERQQAG